MRPKAMGDLATFSAREVKRAAAEGRERHEYFSSEYSGSQNNRQSHPCKLSENYWKGDIRWGEKPEKEGHIKELVDDQNPGPEATPRCRKGREKREQRRCLERSYCQRNNGEGWVGHGH